MSWVLDGVLPEYPIWRNFFDAVVTAAAKPAFFSERRPLLALSPDGTPLGEASSLERGRSYQGGDLGLRASPRDLRERILYVGDHIYGDIYVKEPVADVPRGQGSSATRRRHEPGVLDGSRSITRIADGGRIAVHRSALNVVERRRREPAGGREQARLDAERRRLKQELDVLRRPAATRTLPRTWAGRSERLQSALGLTFKEGNETPLRRAGRGTPASTEQGVNRLLSPLQYFRSPRADGPERGARVRISPWGDVHGAPVAATGRRAEPT
jgi:hypothetical protein